MSKTLFMVCNKFKRRAGGSGKLQPECTNFSPRMQTSSRVHKLQPENENFCPSAQTSARECKLQPESTNFSSRMQTSSRVHKLQPEINTTLNHEKTTHVNNGKRGFP